MEDGTGIDLIEMNTHHEIFELSSLYGKDSSIRSCHQEEKDYLFSRDTKPLFVNETEVSVNRHDAAILREVCIETLF